MKIQEALDIIDDMISGINCHHESIRNHSTCSDRSYYVRMDEENAVTIARYESLRTAIEEHKIEYVF